MFDPVGGRLSRGLPFDLDAQRRSQDDARGSGGEHDNPLSDLHAQAGNQAVGSIISGAGPVPAHNPAAEAQADRVADRAVEQLGPGAVTPPVIGGALSPHLQQALGAVSGLSGLDRVRVHTDAAAERSTERMGARAFSAGRDVSVGRGELSGGIESSRLMAHEAVHAVSHAPAGPGLVHAKLKGTRQAMVDQAGGPTTSGARKFFNIKTNWDKIISGLGAYEEIEAGLLGAGQNPSPQALGRVKGKLLHTLAQIDSACAAWQSANGGEEAAQQAEGTHQKTVQSGEKAESDTRSKVERRQAIAMLLPRIRNEMALLQSPNSTGWLSSVGLNPTQITLKGAEGAGQKNKVSELAYQTENGEFSGFFKAEKGFAKDVELHEIDVGIRQTDPNYGARAMAMYKIDQLLNAGVTARVEFAVNQNPEGKMVMGTVLESAKGSRASDAKMALTDDEAKKTGGVSLNDPVLQSSLNKLQLLDAICGQLDRHAGNYYIQKNAQGSVTGVTGIDLDMAFGQDMNAYNDRSANAAPNYRGLPSMVDADMGRRIMEIRPEDIRSVLKGLLPEAEINATVNRVQSLQVKIAEFEKSGQLVENWNEETAKAQQLKAANVGFSTGRTSYQQDMQNQAMGGIQGQIGQAFNRVFVDMDGPEPLDHSRLSVLGELPVLTRQNIAAALATTSGGYLNSALSYALFDARMTGQTVEAAMLAANEVLADTALMDRMVVMVMESDPGGITTGPLHGVLSDKIRPIVEKVMLELRRRQALVKS